MQRVSKSIAEDYNALHATASLTYQTKDHLVENDRVQGMKSMHDQRGMNKRVLDDNAQFKSIAFMAMVDKQNSVHQDHEHGFYDAAFNRNTFSEYYRHQLEIDAQRPARPVNPDDFEKRKAWDHPVDKPWRNEV